MADEKVTFVLSAQDKATATVKRLKGELNTLGGAGAKASGPLGKLSAVTGGLISPMTLGIGAAAGLGAALVGTVQGASDLNEEIDKSRVVFGPASAEMEEFAKNAADIGLSEQAALGAAGAFGNMFNTVGLAQGASQDMSEAMVTLASDMGSFNNIDPTEMLDKLRSGLSGEAEPLRKYGVLLSETAVKSYALRSGMIEVGDTMTEAEKVTARYNLILEQTEIQQGNFTDTSDSLANIQRTLAAEFQNTSDQIGQKLLPIFVRMAAWVRDEGLPVFNSFIDNLDKLAFVVGKIWDQIVPGGWAQKWGDEVLAATTSVESQFAGWGERWPTNITAVTDGMTDAMGVGVDGMAGEIGALPQKGADALLAEQFKLTGPDGAIAELLEFMNTALDPAQEIFNAQMFLASEEAAAGLESGSPLVVRKTQEMIAEANAVLAAANGAALGYGKAWSSSFAHGITEDQWKAQSAAAGLAQVIRNIMPSSEPKDPRSPLRGITNAWGFGDVLAKGIARSAGAVGGAMRSAVGGVNMPAMGGAMAYASGAGAMGGSKSITINVNAPLGTPAAGQALARIILPELTREQNRQGLR